MAGRSADLTGIPPAYPPLRSSPGAMAGRSGFQQGPHDGDPDPVAILARRDGRAQPAAESFGAAPWYLLRSSPGAMAGRSLGYACVGPGRGAGGCDPRPARWPGAAGQRIVVVDEDPGQVAILARRDGRAQPGNR